MTESHLSDEGNSLTIRVRIKITKVVSKSRIKIFKITTTQKHDTTQLKALYILFMTGSFILAVDSNAESSVRTVLEGREFQIVNSFSLGTRFYVPIAQNISVSKILVC